MRLNLLISLVLMMAAVASGFTEQSTIWMKERAAARTDRTVFGQDWVKSTNPNAPWYTNGDGTDNIYIIVLGTEWSGVATNDTIKWDGTNWQLVPYITDLSFSIALFTDNEATTQLIGTGVWETTGNIAFVVTYNNPPPTAATITISSDDGGYGVWGTNPLVMSDPWETKATTEDTDYPATRGQYVRFTLDTTPSDSDTETVTFQNYLYWGPSTTGSSFNEAIIEALSGSAISSSFTTNRSINAGASNYLVYAIPNYTDLYTGADYETDGNRGTSFKFNSITCAFTAKETVASVINVDGYDEAYEVYASIETNLGSSTLIITTSSAATNTIYWGEHTGTDASEAVIEGMNGGSSAASNDNTRTFSLAPGAGEYIWFAYPKRLGTVSIRDSDTGLPLSLYASSPQTVSVTNSNGWSEDYYAYRSEFANLGAINLETY